MKATQSQTERRTERDLGGLRARGTQTETKIKREMVRKPVTERQREADGGKGTEGQ